MMARALPERSILLGLPARFDKLRHYSPYFPPWPALSGLALAALAPLVAFALRLALKPVMPSGAVFVFFIAAVVVVAVRDGLIASVLALAFCIPLASLLMQPLSSLNDPVGFVSFAAIGIGIAIMGEYLVRARTRAAMFARTLQDREVRLRSLLESVPDAIVVVDDQGIVQSFSHVAERLFGYQADEVVGANVTALISGARREGDGNHFGRYFGRGDSRAVGAARILVGARKDGSTFPMELAIGEIRSEERRYFTAVVRDLTERQQAEVRFRELQAELAHVSRLTAMGEMASNLAHELNQPISAVANYLQGSQSLLVDGRPNLVDLSEGLARASEQAFRAGEIIHRMRNFVARGETESQAENLPKLIAEASALALIGNQDQDLRVRFNLDHRVELAFVDRIQIQQVLHNLIRNAVEAMAEVRSSSRKLTISTRPVADHRIEISVADSGPGVSALVGDRLFRPFVSTKKHGLGVGLSISRAIVESHGGDIWVEPNLDGGAVFKFTLPSVVSGEAAHVR